MSPLDVEIITIGLFGLVGFSSAIVQPTLIAPMAPTILRVGSDEQKNHWLPMITRGEIEFAAGYSEPEAGTDLASLRTRADLDGDHYVVSGQKAWNTGAHSATHQWLAVRTDPE